VGTNQGVTHDRHPFTPGLFQRLDQRQFQPLRIEFDRARGDFGIRCAHVTKLAGRQPAVADFRGRAETAAGDGPRIVKIARAGGGIESGAGEFVGGIREILLAEELSGARIAWIDRGDLLDVRRGTGADGGGARRVRRFERSQPRAQTQDIELGDGERTDAALRTAEAARQPRTAPPRGLDHRRSDRRQQIAIGVFDLDER